jgi:hypothetical protein
MSIDEIEENPHQYTILAERVEDGRVVEQSVTGERRADELYDRWDESEQLHKLRVKRSQPMDDVTRQFEHSWPPTGNEPVSSDGGTDGWRTR